MPMLQIGPVAFETTGTHYDKLKNAFKATWVRQKRFSRADALQYTGTGEVGIKVSGTIWTDYFGWNGTLGTLRDLSPYPQIVVSGAGDVFGLWAITEVNNEQSIQDQHGIPRKVTFDIALEAYGEDEFFGGGDIIGLTAGIGGVSIGVSAGIQVGANGVGVQVGANIGGFATLF